MQDPLRVGMFTTFYPPYNFGGDGIGVNRLATGLARIGCDVTVVHDRDAYVSLAHKEPAPRQADPGVKTIGLRTQGILSPLLTQQLGRPMLKKRELNQILDDGAFDVLWFHNVSLVGGPALLAMGDAVKIYEAHEHWLVCPTHVLWRDNKELCDSRHCVRCQISYQRPPQAWRHTGLLERNLRHVDRFIAKSDFSKAKHAAFGFKPDMTVVPYFLPDLDQSAIEPYRAERPYLLFVGRLEKIKGLQDVIPAFAGSEGLDLVIVGSGTYENELRALAAGMPRVKFIGQVPSEQVSSYYRGAEALIVPSVCYETFGIILIEAFRLGTPVLARHIGPFPEIAGKGGGLLFKDTDELVSLVSQLDQDRALAERLRVDARASFEKYWREDVVIAQYLDVVRDAAEARGDARVLTKLRGLQ
jgi:glycosyltransferase involved in cell wall biosynthesis